MRQFIMRRSRAFQTAEETASRCHSEERSDEESALFFHRKTDPSLQLRMTVAEPYLSRCSFEVARKQMRFVSALRGCRTSRQRQFGGSKRWPSFCRWIWLSL